MKGLSITREASVALLAVMVAASYMLTPEAAMAQAVFGEAEDRVWQLYEALRGIVYVVGGIGIIVLAIFAFFGRFKWTQFFALAGGMFLIAMTDQLIQFLGGEGIGY
jgi:type IV secretory pathway VirB2 component (pilin)